jgi:hypothetical protein
MAVCRPVLVVLLKFVKIRQLVPPGLVCPPVNSAHRNALVMFRFEPVTNTEVDSRGEQLVHSAWAVLN